MEMNQDVKRGCEHPYDATDDQAYEGGDPARMAVLGMLNNLCGRSGIKHGFSNIDDDVRVEIVDDLTEIVRAAFEQDAAASVADDTWDPTPEQRAEWEAAVAQEKIETEAWKVAQLATTLAAGEETGSPGKIFGPEDGSRHVENARWILAESRRQVAAERGITP